MLVNFLSDEDFQDFVDKYKLFVVGIRPSKTEWNMRDLYIKSKSGKDYRQLLNEMRYHPPAIAVSSEKARDGELYLDHAYEGRSLYTPYITPVLIGLEFFWGRRVVLETTEYEQSEPYYWWQQKSPKYKKARDVQNSIPFWNIHTISAYSGNNPGSIGPANTEDRIPNNTSLIYTLWGKTYW